MTQKKTEVAVTKDISQSERFTNAVVKEFSGEVGKVELTGHQRRLIQNYFIKLDRTLKDSEQKRQGKSNPDTLTFDWANVNMTKLAQEVVALSSVGLDPLQPNHINLLPFKNNHTNKYDIVSIIGYRGLEIKATKYGLDVPDHVIVELVYDTDVFKQFKKDMDTPVETYSFEVTDEFNRGKIKGGFYYFIYNDAPEKNRLRVFNVSDVEKRKPKYASAEFWGGEKDKWVSGKKAGKETIEGWYDEMCWKTIYRHAYSSITIDSEKIDEYLQKILEIESEVIPTMDVEEQVAHEIKEGANKGVIDFEEVEETEEETTTKEPGF